MCRTHGLSFFALGAFDRTFYNTQVKELLGIVAALIAIAAYVPYLRGIRRGVVQPHPYTWIISAIVSGIILAGQISGGAGVGALPTATSALLTFLIFLLSLKNGLRHITTIDTVFLAVAVCSIVPWLLTKDPTISVVLAVTIDCIAFVPTIRKTWVAPTSESSLLYGANVVRHILTLFSLEAFTIATALHSIVMTLANAGVTLIIALRTKKVLPTDAQTGRDSA